MATATTEPASPRTNALRVSKSNFSYTPCYCEENAYLLCRTLACAGRAKPDASDLYVVFISNEQRKVPLWKQRAGEGREGGLVVWDYHVLCLQMRDSAGSVERLREQGLWQNCEGQLNLRGPQGTEEQLAATGQMRRDREQGQSDPERHTCSGRQTTEFWCESQLLEPLIWDLDALLPFPSTLLQYSEEALWDGKQNPLSLSDDFQRLFRIVHAPQFLRCLASDRSHMRTSTGQWLSPPPNYPCIVAEDGTTNNLEKYISMKREDVSAVAEMNVVDSKYGQILSEGTFLAYFGSFPS